MPFIEEFHSYRMLFPLSMKCVAVLMPHVLLMNTWRIYWRRGAKEDSKCRIDVHINLLPRIPSDHNFLLLNEASVGQPPAVPGVDEGKISIVALHITPRHVLKVETRNLLPPQTRIYPSYHLRAMRTLLISLLLSILPPLSQCQLHPDNDLSISLPFTSASQNFDTFGSAALLSDTIVLTPHSPAHILGAIWAKKPNPHTYWEVEFSLRVSGAERGGNGLAFWYSGKRGLGGNIFGSIDQWDGLGLFFDGNTGGKVYSFYCVANDSLR
jgi:hypothetical protein